MSTRSEGGGREKWNEKIFLFLISDLTQITNSHFHYRKKIWKSIFSPEKYCSPPSWESWRTDRNGDAPSYLSCRELPTDCRTLIEMHCLCRDGPDRGRAARIWQFSDKQMQKSEKEVVIVIVKQAILWYKRGKWNSSSHGYKNLSLYGWIERTKLMLKSWHSHKPQEGRVFLDPSWIVPFFQSSSVCVEDVR